VIAVSASNRGQNFVPHSLLCRHDEGLDRPRSQFGPHRYIADPVAGCPHRIRDIGSMEGMAAVLRKDWRHGSDSDAAAATGYFLV
jgi:hypothetical protein